MSPNKRKCLEALAECYREEPDHYWPFKPLIARTGMNPETIRRTVRMLKRDGFAEFAAGLCDMDGEFAGAGYRITPAGLAAAEGDARMLPGGACGRGGAV